MKLKDPPPKLFVCTVVRLLPKAAPAGGCRNG
jgi:hypothetical protein